MVVTLLVLLRPVPHVYGCPGHASALPVQHLTTQHHGLILVLQLGLGSQLQAVDHVLHEEGAQGIGQGELPTVLRP